MSRCCLYDAGSAILFLGILASNIAIHREANRALSELTQFGYNIPAKSSPVSVTLVNTTGDFTTKHAGGWRPGVIYIRDGTGEQLVLRLRHELMHEATHRTCSEAFPRWAAEAAAISFSGEIETETIFPTNDKIAYLNKQLLHNTPLDMRSYSTLVALVSNLGWTPLPCKIKPEYCAFITSCKQ